MNRIRIGVLFGGRSSEHAISCVSAAGVLAALNPETYDVTAVGITRSGLWRLFEGPFADLAISGDALPEVAELGPAVQLILDPSAPGFLIEGREVPLDVVFPVLHGPWGEDGSISGLLEICGIPYVGSGVLASSAAMDKIVTKTVLAASGLDVGTWIEVAAGESPSEGAERAVEALGLPVFVKPARAGSSRGISRVGSVADLASGIERARHHDPKVIIEAAVIDAREIECGVLMDARGMEVSVCAEIVVTEGFDFYDFTAKYLSDGADLIVPAQISAELQERIQSVALAAVTALGCEGLARVDFFVTADDRILVSEVNTMPGFTPISMFPRMFIESGYTFEEIVETLVSEALRRPKGLRPSLSRPPQ